MERNLEEPVPIARIAEAAGLSERQLERLFRRDLKATPGRLLRPPQAGARPQPAAPDPPPRSSRSPSRQGFGSAAAFSRAYRSHFGLSPSQDRAE